MRPGGERKHVCGTAESALEPWAGRGMGEGGQESLRHTQRPDHEKQGQKLY